MTFDGTNGAGPQYGNLIADADGNLLGTTYQGGTLGLGTVFMIRKTKGVYASRPTVLFSFDGLAHGCYPIAGLLADANGNLFGTASECGAHGLGTVFMIARTNGVYASTPTVLFSFDGLTNGNYPWNSGLLADANGNLFGTAYVGGANGLGTVFMIPKMNGVYASTPTVLFSFDGTHGANPTAGLIADTNGNLFGTTQSGGARNLGTVFTIAKTNGVYASTPTVLFNFDVTHGSNVWSGLAADANGNLFGTTGNGGTYDSGTVFMIAKTNGVYARTPTVLCNFDGIHGSFPVSAPLIDANGNLFVTTPAGGLGFGTVFKIAKTNGVYDSTPTILTYFTGTPGGQPESGLLADASGNLFGTNSGGPVVDGFFLGFGTVFQLAGTGFVPPVRFAGTPGTANCNGAIISSLAHTYGSVAAAANALGYGSVADLQSAVSAYCGN